MEVYLNIAETGIGTYGVNAGAERYFDKDESSLSRTEAARNAAVLPLPKEREATSQNGFTRRYGHSLPAPIRALARDTPHPCPQGHRQPRAPGGPAEAEMAAQQGGKR